MEDFRPYARSLVPLPDATLDAVEGLMQRRELPKNAFFAQAGDYTSDLAFLRSGIMRGYYRTEDAHEYNKSLFVGPTMVGALSSLATGRMNQIYIQALSPCELYVVDYPSLLRLYDEHPSLERFARRFVEFVYVQKEEREIDLVLLSARERYEKFLQEYGHVAQDIPLYHVAAYLGVTPTQLSRIRAAMARG